MNTISFLIDLEDNVLVLYYTQLSKVLNTDYLQIKGKRNSHINKGLTKVIQKKIDYFVIPKGTTYTFIE